MSQPAAAHTHFLYLNLRRVSSHQPQPAPGASALARRSIDIGTTQHSPLSPQPPAPRMSYQGAGLGAGIIPMGMPSVAGPRAGKERCVVKSVKRSGGRVVGQCIRSAGPRAGESGSAPLTWTGARTNMASHVITCVSQACVPGLPPSAITVMGQGGSNDGALRPPPNGDLAWGSWVYLAYYALQSCLRRCIELCYPSGDYGWQC
jgi:hypothetical protein